ncbi:MAG: prohibitin family protein [Deltaproteobacteria bacterium]|nr:prohibitin family protein [Deltaproteobacteria bacterium]
MILLIFFSIVCGAVYGVLKKRFRGESVSPRILIYFVLAGILLGVSAQSFVIIRAGTVGVVDFWGNVSPEPLYAGIRLINPLAVARIFSVKTHELKEIMDTPSKEGLITHLEVSVWYRLIPEKAPEVFKTIGMGYEDTILKPLIRSVLRTVTAEYEAKALYTAGREAIVAEMQKMAEPVGREKGLLIERVLLRSVKLPQVVADAIERKLEAEQQAEQMRFILERERQEAERKKIEAHGISEFQKIVTQGITESLLEWKGIEATEKIAGSPNTKIVIIGNPKNGMPLIFEGQKNDPQP